MSDTIYSDLWGEVLINELGDKRVYLYDNTTLRKPSIILPNLLAVEKLRDYLNEILK